MLARKHLIHHLVSKCVNGTFVVRTFATTSRTFKFNVPPTANDLPRPAGIASMFRLPVQSTAAGLDACFVGVPFDCGASNRVGARFGPRQIRSESVMMRNYNKDTGAMPYHSLNVADVGDVALNQYITPEACKDIRAAFSKLIANGCKTLAMGGDHTITYPILQAYKEKYGPVGLIHVDAHSDTSESMYGATITHGTPFRRAVEDGCLDCARVYQIGLRGSGYSLSDYQWSLDQGFRVIPAKECWHKSLSPLMEEIRSVMGDAPVYISFDIDGLDPSIAPGTGTPEIGGLTAIQGLEIIRGSKGLNVVGCDLVEVSPPYDTTGNTALAAANLLFEMLCILPGIKYGDIPR